MRRGDLFALAAASCWAVFNVASRSVVTRFTPAFTNCLIYALGSPVLFVLGWAEGPWTQLTAAAPRRSAASSPWRSSPP